MGSRTRTRRRDETDGTNESPDPGIIGASRRVVSRRAGAANSVSAPSPLSPLLKFYPLAAGMHSRVVPSPERLRESRLATRLVPRVQRNLRNKLASETTLTDRYEANALHCICMAGAASVINSCRHESPPFRPTAIRRPSPSSPSRFSQIAK